MVKRVEVGPFQQPFHQNCVHIFKSWLFSKIATNVWMEATSAQVTRYAPTLKDLTPADVVEVLMEMDDSVQVRIVHQRDHRVFLK